MGVSCFVPSLPFHGVRARRGKVEVLLYRSVTAFSVLLLVERMVVFLNFRRKIMTASPSPRRTAKVSLWWGFSIFLSLILK